MCRFCRPPRQEVLWWLCVKDGLAEWLTTRASRGRAASRLETSAILFKFIRLNSSAAENTPRL